MTLPCIHRWDIESPNGSPVLRGRCKHCGAERVFLASSEVEWKGDKVVYRNSSATVLVPGYLQESAIQLRELAAAKSAPSSPAPAGRAPAGTP